jgi:hypothetical protein
MLLRVDEYSGRSVSLSQCFWVFWNTFKNWLSQWTYVEWRWASRSVLGIKVYNEYEQISIFPLILAPWDSGELLKQFCIKRHPPCCQF